MISHLLLTEPAPLTAHEDESTNDSSLRVLLTLCDLLNRELLVLIGWAKQIPGTHLSAVHHSFIHSFIFFKTKRWMLFRTAQQAPVF